MEDERELIDRLRAGDEAAFVLLVHRHHATMLHLASSFVPSLTVAEDVVQDTWLGVLRGLGGFEGRSSFRTWLFRILVNRARTAGARERRTVPVGTADAIGDAGAGRDRGPAVDPSRFTGSGQWLAPPEQWVEAAEDRLRAGQLAGRIRSAIGELPDRQRAVVTLRDVEGLSSAQVCQVLEITEANQRVLLHRGRSRVRQVLESELGRA
jgi:RNA polymerase sigma-70 factor, ECF subfamily